MRKATTKQRQGFTTIELMIVVLIMAILASVAVPAFGRTHVQITLQVAADHLASALRYAQSMAVNDCGRYAVVPSVKDNSFYVANAEASSLPVVNPAMMQPYRVSFEGHRLFDGVVLTAMSFSSPIEFDYLGSTVSGGWIELRIGDERIRVEVQAITGRVSVDHPTS